MLAKLVGVSTILLVALIVLAGVGTMGIIQPMITYNVTSAVQLEMAAEMQQISIWNALQASGHALDKHTEAADIMRCLLTRGPYLNFKMTRKAGGWYIPCQLDDGTIGLGIFYDNTGGDATAFIPKDGTWAAVKKYMDDQVRHGLASISKAVIPFLK